MAKKKNDKIKKYIIDLIERTIGTFAEALIGAIGASATFGEVHWGFAFSTAGLASLITVLKCLAAMKTGDSGNASLVA